MAEMRLDILESREVKAFDPTEWLKKQIEGLQKEFEKEYKLSNITLGVTAGIPSGVTGSLTITLTPKSRKTA
jgi:hypothetical protein